MSRTRSIQKIIVVLLFTLIIFSSQANFPIYNTRAATEINPQPTLQVEKHTLPDLNITVTIILDPMIELQQSFIYMEINMSFNPVQIEKVGLLRVKSAEDKYNAVITVSPEDGFFDIPSPKFDVQIPFPTSYYYYVPIKPKAMYRFTHPKVTYLFNTTVYYRNTTVSSYLVKSNSPVSGVVLPSSADMPVTLQNGIIASITLAVLAPIGVWLINRKRKKNIRKKRFQESVVTVILFIILILSSSLILNAVPQVSAISTGDKNYLLEYSITTYKDIYNNNTFYPNTSYGVYIWYAAPLNSNSVNVGTMLIGKSPLPKIRYYTVNFQTHGTNASTEEVQCFWFAPEDVKSQNTVDFMGFNLKVSGYHAYYIFSMLREAVVLEKNDSQVYIRGYFDRKSKILYQLAIQNKTEDTIVVYQLNYLFGLKLSEKWDYYYEIFSVIIALPTIIVGILTWPKSSRNLKREREEIRK